jgi:hypothetical protein
MRIPALEIAVNGQWCSEWVFRLVPSMPVNAVSPVSAQRPPTRVQPMPRGLGIYALMGGFPVGDGAWPLVPGHGGGRGSLSPSPWFP